MNSKVRNEKQDPICIVNGPLVVNDEKVMLNQHTGEFLEALSQRTQGLHLIQYYLTADKSDYAGGLNAFDIKQTSFLHSTGVKYHVRNVLLKRLGNLFLFTQALFTIPKAPWIYIFLPGTFPNFACRVARMFGLTYGLYVRGTIDLGSQAILKALAGSKLTVCNNDYTAKQLAGLSDNIQVARPMMLVTHEDIYLKREVCETVCPRILYVGRLEEPKGIEDLFLALERLYKEGNNFTVDLVGTGPLAQPSLLSSGLRERVHFRGFVSSKDDLANYYLDADIFVFPSHFEGFPRVLYEAMTYGLPIVTTLVGGIQSVMQDEVNCMCVQPRRPRDLERVLSTLMSDVSLRARLSREATRTIQCLHEGTRLEHAEIVHKEMYQ